MGDWNSEQYMKFKGERTQPSVDLINRLGDDFKPKTVLDLGCGPGNSTFALYNKFKNAKITGVDASENMLEKARKSYDFLNFKKCFLPTGLNEIDGRFDLIFSNACIHWIPEQKELLNSAFEKLNNGGKFAVQIPFIQQAPFYKLLYAMINEEKWQKLQSINNFHNLMPDEYFDILASLSSDFEIWQTTYYHRVPNFKSIIEWYRGSGLRPYLEALTNDEKQVFENELLEKIKNNYPVQKNGEIILKMPRLFFILNKNGKNA